MNRIWKLFYVLFMSMSLSLIGQAQGATPQYVIDAARNAATTDLPALGSPTGWSHIILNDITTTALGCTLVQGVTLPSPIDVYKVELDFSGAKYNVFVSADATMVQLCDSRFPGMSKGVSGANPNDPNSDTDGDSIKNSEDACPLISGVADTSRNGCPLVKEGDKDGDGVGDSVDFCPDQAGSKSSDGCPLITDTDSDGVPDVSDICANNAGVIREGFAEGCPLNGSGTSVRVRQASEICRVVVSGQVNLLDNAASNGTVLGTLSADQALSQANGIVVGRTSDTAWYQTSGGWIPANTVSLSGSCYNIPVTNAPVGSATGCYLRSSGTFANVRTGPTTNDSQVGQIFPNESFPVLGRTGLSDWYFFNRGWVAKDVIELSGDCSLVPEVNPQTAGSGSVFFCPPGFTGYLPPRIAIGSTNARISGGSTPNRLRAEPTVASDQVGEIQPGRILNAVLDGPACNEGYVWWQVRIDELVGWTVESDINANAYYVEPIDSAGNVLDAAQQATPIPQSPPPSTEANPSTFQMISSSNAHRVDTLRTLATTNAIRVAWSPVNSHLGVITADRKFTLYNYPTFDDITALLNLPTDLQVTAFAFSADEEYLAIGNADGSIYLVQFADGSLGASGLLPQAHTASVRALDWSHAGHTLASVSGLLDNAIQAEWTLKVWNLEGYNPLTKILPPLQINYAYPYPLTDVAFNANDQYVAITGESPTDERAALWIYSLADAQEQFSKGLVYMQGFTFVSDTPDASLGDFVYGNGDEADQITLDGKQDKVFYSDSGLFVGEVEFRPQVITGAEILFAVRNASPGAFSGAETITFMNALNNASPSGSLTLSAVDIAFSPDGRVLAAIDAETGTVYLLGVTDS